MMADKTHDSKEQISATYSRYDLVIDGDVDDGFRIVANIERWPALFPHVRETVSLGDDRWLVRVAWRWLPLKLTCRVLVDPESRRVEQLISTGMGVQVACLWVVFETPDGNSRVSVAARATGGMKWLRQLVLPLVGNDLLARTLAMVQLLSEADRKAHDGIT